MINVNQITAQMARMPDQALQQYAEMHKDDPYTLSLALNESNRRKQMRAEAQTGPNGQQPTVVDQGLASIAEQPQPQMPQGQPPQGQMAQAAPMPEEVGIGALPAPNMQNMADGGIVSFADGGEVQSFQSGGAPKDPMERYEAQIRAEAERQGVDPDMAVRLFRAESGGRADAVSPKGAAGLGQLMVPAAKEMGLKPEERFDPEKNIPASIGYFKKQLDQFKNPEAALAAYNWGPGNVQKHLAKNEGQINRTGLPKETAEYLNKLLPFGTAYAAPTTAPADTSAAGQIPGQTYKAPAPTQAQPSWLAKKATELGISEDTQRNISNLATAAGGAMGAGYIPRYLPKVSGGIAALGERAAELISPSKQLTAAQIEAMQAANTAKRVAEAGQFVGPVSETAQAARAADLARLAQVPSKAEQVQTAAMLRQAQEANRLAAAGKSVQYGGQAAGPGLGQGVPSAGAAPVASDEARIAAQEDFRRREYAAMNAPTPTAAAPGVMAAPGAAPAEKPSWLTNDRALMMGLQMLAGSGKPGSGNAIRDLLSSAGSAGLGTLAQEREERKAKATEAETTAKGKYYGALADMTERGGKEKNEVQLAEKTAQEALTNWAKSNQMAMLQSPGLYEQMRQKYRMEAYNQYGIPMQAPVTGASSRPGWGIATAQ
jgi:hypothetical protein